MPHQEENVAEQIGLIPLAPWFQYLCVQSHRASKSHEYRRGPTTTTTRLFESHNDEPLDRSKVAQYLTGSTPAPEETVLYLAYGSNLCRETFRKKRGIKPLSQVNVVIPELVMTFDLPGMPYTEPCFSNTRYRRAAGSNHRFEAAVKEGYHKDDWHKGLVGVVYEVTLADYVHIIATEGGGASYQDVLVDCYALPDDPSVPVPIVPSGISFKAHTLFAPAAPASKGGRPTRPDPSYAQPSPRYLKLITDGAKELTLPYEYQNYLHSIHPYQKTTTKQQLGEFIFLLTWRPLLAFVFAAGRSFVGKDGRYPNWLVTLAANIFLGMWACYDNFFKGLFGDGERTMEPAPRHVFVEEKQHLLADEAV